MHTRKFLSKSWPASPPIGCVSRFENDGVNRPDLGASSGNSPYRFRPLVWSYSGANYLNERTVGVQQSGWAFIAQLRSWLPDPIKGVLWFAPDDR